QHLAFLCLDRNELREARAYCAAALRIQREVWRKQEFASALDFCAEIACRDRNFTRAACLLGAAATERNRYGLEITQRRPQAAEAMRDAAQAEIGAPAFESHWERGAAMTLEQALDFALDALL